MYYILCLTLVLYLYFLHIPLTFSWNNHYICVNNIGYFLKIKYFKQFGNNVTEKSKDYRCMENFDTMLIMLILWTMMMMKMVKKCPSYCSLLTHITHIWHIHYKWSQSCNNFLFSVLLRHNIYIAQLDDLS